MTDYADLTLAEAATQIRQKALSPVEYLQALLARIDTYDAHYNAFLRQTPDIALRQARQAEAEIMSGTWRGPLHGVPYGLKDIIDVAGVPTTAHSKILADNLAHTDAVVTQRLHAAGGVLVGKLATHNALLLNIIAGHDPADPASARVPVVDFTRDLDKGVKGLKIGVIRRFYTQDMVADPEMTQSIEDAVTVLERQGAEMHTLDPGPLAEYAAITRVILLSEAYAIHERWLQERPQDYGALMRERVLVGAFFRAVDYVQATRQRAVLVEQFARCLDPVEVAITASSMDPACPVEDAERCEYTYNRQARAPLNLTGNPALAVPTGFASTGLPLSMQIIGKAFDEATVYRVARAYEQATPWTSTHPVLA